MTMSSRVGEVSEKLKLRGRVSTKFYSNVSVRPL